MKEEKVCICVHRDIVTAVVDNYNVRLYGIVFDKSVFTVVVYRIGEH